MPAHSFLNPDLVVVGGGHAGVEAAWAACNLGCRVVLVTLDAGKIGAMSCNPAIGGLAKGQMVREIDAMGGLMGLAADATGIQFRVLNASKGQAVRGPRCQSDKYQYALAVQHLLSLRENLTIVQGAAEKIDLVEGRVAGLWVSPRQVTAGSAGDGCEQGQCSVDDSPYDRLVFKAQVVEEPVCIRASAVVLTTGTFMRGLMHTGERRVAGGRVGELPAVGISGALRELGLELGRLKTGTPPRLDGRTIDFDGLEEQPGDERPVPFSDMSGYGPAAAHPIYAMVAERFPVLPQRVCHITTTSAASHQTIRDNLHRAPLFNGQIEKGSVGPRYCPSIEDKVVRFADRDSHHVYLEPESLHSDEVYCNGISTSLPADVQDVIVASLPGCGRAKILRYGYAVEYDMVWPHQIDATTMTKRVPGLFLAGQINGTSGYEEAAAQGLLAGLNAARWVRGEPAVRPARNEAYLGVLMDDLVTCRPREPYRMFTSRAEYRLQLRADNADRRLTPMARQWGLVDDLRWSWFMERRQLADDLRALMGRTRCDGVTLLDWMRRPGIDATKIMAMLRESTDQIPSAVATPADGHVMDVLDGLISEERYSGYLKRQHEDAERLQRHEHQLLPEDIDYATITGLRSEAVQNLSFFRPATIGQASRLAGVTPADVLLILLKLNRRPRSTANSA